ncbi:MAG: Hsp20/alpha crystallin family protein [Patescibacteria group bacterium]
MFSLKKKNKTDKEKKGNIEISDESPADQDVIDAINDQGASTEEEEGLTEEGQLSVDVYQDKSNIIIRSTIAGVEPEDIDITFDNDMITIRGKRKKDASIREENYFYQECYWGSFSRSIILPVEVQADKIKASIRNGVLTIVMPKSHKDLNIKVEEED